jgi:hypothetical protein
MTISIGSDPEVMLREKSTGRIIAACGLIGGTKGKAKQMNGLPEGYGVQEDNVMVEFNIPPVTSAREFTRANHGALDWIESYLEVHYPHLELDNKASRVLLHDQLESPQAATFGCSVDYNAHANGEQAQGIDPRRLETAEGAWRFNGAHVHLGYDCDVPKYVAAQFADVFMGLPSIGLDVQGLRRTAYGAAGRFRPTPYGIEYRTLSNFWLWDKESTTDVGRKAIHLCEWLECSDEARIRDAYANIPWIDVAKAINTEDVTMATDLLAFISDKHGVL